MKKSAICGAALLTLGVASALTTGVYAENNYLSNVQDVDDLKACFALNAQVYENVVCQLNADITITSSSDILTVGREATLDLNGHTIETDGVNINNGIITVNHGGNLTIDDTSEDKNGKITTGNTTTTAAIRMTGETNNTDPAVLTVKNGILEGWYYGIAGNGSTGRDNTVINIEGGTIRAKDSSDSTGIFNPQDGEVNVSGGLIIGVTGIEMRAGTLNVEGGRIVSSYNGATASVANGSGSTTLGAGIAIAQHTTQKPIEINISDGFVAGYTAVYLSNPQNNPVTENDYSGSITGGTFYATNGGTNPVVSTIEGVEDFVYGGTFNVEPGELAEYHYSVINNDGNYDVIDATALESEEKDKEGVLFKAAQKEETDYTVTSWNNLQTKVNAAKNLLTAAKGHAGSQATFDEAVKDIEDALDALVYIRDLAVEANLATGYNKAYFSEASFKNYTDALHAAQKIVNNEVIVNQTDVDTALDNLKDSKEDLVGIKDLYDDIMEAKGRASDDNTYTKSARKALNEAILDAQKVYEDSTLIGDEGKQTVADARAALKEVYDSLETAENERGDIFVMRRYVEEIQARDADEDDDFSIENASEQSAKFAAAYKAAAEYVALDDEEELNAVNQEALEEATTKLVDSYMHLYINGEGMDALLEALADAFAKLLEADYTNASTEPLEEVLDDIEELLIEASESDLGEEDIKAELEELTEDLIEATEALVEAVDTDDLEAALLEAEGYDADSYTEESYAVLTAAIEAGNAVIDEDYELSDENQAIVDEATEVILAAIEALVAVKTPDTGILTNAEGQTASSSNIVLAALAGLATACYSAYKLIFKRKNEK